MSDAEKTTGFAWVRKEHRRSDTAFLILAIIIRGPIGYFMSTKVSEAIGIPFALFSTAILYFLWRKPESSGVLPR